MSLLSQAVANYLNSWEGSPKTQGENIQNVVKTIKSSTVDELNTEHNALTAQELWEGPLIDVFFEEVQSRLFGEGTFAISTAWSSVDEWKVAPFALVRLSFEETYTPLDTDSTVIGINLGRKTILLMNDSFNESISAHVLRMLVRYDVAVLVKVDNAELKIVGLRSLSDPEETIFFEPFETAVAVPATQRESGEFNLLRRMYESLRKANPEIVDVYYELRTSTPLLPQEEEEDEE